MAYENEAYEGFDVEIGKEADEGGFVVLPDGEYPFKVVEMEREYYNGGASIPACPLAVVTLAVDGGDLGTARVKHRLYMCKRQSWKVKQLFVGLGLVDEAVESFTPPWPRMFGEGGYVRLTSHVHDGKTYNDVDRILKPAEAAEAAGRAISGQAAPASAPWG